MKKILIARRNGITLVEVMVSLAIITSVMGVIYTTLLVGNRSWLVFLDNIAVQHEARNALYYMTRELRDARDIFVTKEEDAVALRFKKPTFGIISYTWSSKGENAQKIVRKLNANTRVIARNISDLSFEYLNNNAILIDVTATKKPIVGSLIQFHLVEKIAFRSKIGLVQ